MERVRRKVELMWDDLKLSQIEIMRVIETNPDVSDEHLYLIGKSFKLQNELEEVNRQISNHEQRPSGYELYLEVHDEKQD